MATEYRVSWREPGRRIPRGEVFASDDPLWKDYDSTTYAHEPDNPVPGGLKGALGLATATAIEQKARGNIVGGIQKRTVGEWGPV